MKRAKWFIYTVIIGLIPFFIRTLIYWFDNTATAGFWFNAIDFVVLGLVLNLTNINELEDKAIEDKLWKTTNIGWSVISIAIFSALLAIVTYAEFKGNKDINETAVKFCAIFLASVSFIFSYSIYDRLTKLDS